MRAAVYAEFVYGIGTVPALPMGRPVSYTKTRTVYRQEFERGVALANVGAETCHVDLGHPYFDLDGVARTSVSLPPHGAEVLLRNPAEDRGSYARPTACL